MTTTKKRNITISIALAAAIIVATLATVLIGINNSKGVPSSAVIENTDNNLIVTPQEQNGAMRLAVTPLAASDITPFAEQGYTVTATIQPASALQRADWSVAWKNAGSSWANGKTVADYITITPIEEGSLTATLACKKAFSEQVILTAKASANNSIAATCTVDYQQRLNINSITLAGTTLSTTASNFKAEVGKTHIIDVKYSFTDGTIKYLGKGSDTFDEFVCAGVAFTDEFIAAYNANRGTAPALTKKMKRANVSSEVAYTREVEFTDGAYGNTVFYQLMGGYFSDVKMAALRAAVNSVGEDNVFKIGVFKTTSAITDTYVECDIWYKLGLKASTVYMATTGISMDATGFVF